MKKLYNYYTLNKTATTAMACLLVYNKRKLNYVQ